MVPSVFRIFSMEIFAGAVMMGGDVFGVVSI
jgi:hypothetical protein